MRWASITAHLDKDFSFLVVVSLWSSCYPSVYFFLDSKCPKKNRRYCNKQTRKGWITSPRELNFWHPPLEGYTVKSVCPKKFPRIKPKEKPPEKKPKTPPINRHRKRKRIRGKGERKEKLKPEVLKPASISKNQELLRRGWISRRSSQPNKITQRKQ